MGEGRSGCLGHGDTRDLELPKIVEALLGDHIAEISAGEKHLAVLTGDGEVFTWGEDSGGCLAQGKLSSSLLTRPELLELEEDVAAVVCASQATAVIAPDGRLMVAGSNNNNRLGLDTPGHTVENSSLLTPLLSLGPVLNLSIGESCSLVLSRSREVWRLGGEGRAVTRLDLGLDSVGLVVALPTSGALLTTQGHLYTFGYRKSNKTRINIEEERERAAASPPKLDRLEKKEKAKREKERKEKEGKEEKETSSKKEKKRVRNLIALNTFNQDETLIRNEFQDRDSEGSEGTIKKRREGEERDEKVQTNHFISFTILLPRS